MSYYTKYRPQRIEELDLVSVRQSLSSILKSGKFSHAYLFTGPKGTGKTSSARIVAKVLNCEKNKKQLSEPCNECENCRRITGGSSLACLEMDAASNRGIDDIRLLKERVGLAPAEGRFTVYIIDEVHMLTTEAFNALLKTLEEPPDHAVFILCTTDPQKIPETVISRCTRVQFFKATIDEVVQSLNKVVNGEKIEVEAGGLEKIAESVDGSFRDGMKLLEQVALGNDGKVTLLDVERAVGADESYDPTRLLEALRRYDVSEAMGELKLRQEGGVDLVVFGKRLLELIRSKLIASLEKREMPVELLELAEVVDEMVVKMKVSVMPNLVFEVMVVKWCAKKQRPEEKVVVKSEKKASETVEVRVKEKVEVEVEEKPEVIVVAKDLFAGKLEEVVEKWQLILAAVRPLNHSLEALLRSARPRSITNGTLEVEAFYKFHKEQLEQERHRQKLEEAMAKVLGGRIRLEIVLGERQGVKLEPVEDDALVKAAEEIFG